MAIRLRYLLLAILIATSFALFAGTTALAQPEGGGAIMAIEEKPLAGGGRATSSMTEGQGRTATSSKSAALPTKTTSPKTTRNSPRSATPANSNARYNGPVIGDKYSFLNFEIAEKVQPIWTIKAKNAGASGLVQVEILVDENGNVLSAHARTGNPLLYPEAERAALATRFNKPTVNGQRARALGFVVYRFGKSEDDDDN
jgi:outer membrane biosynthesis protein TonB